MQRRKFLHRAGASGAALAAVAAPSVAQTGMPEIRWRIASSYPKSLTSIYGAMEMVTKRLGELTDGKFNVSLHAAGELVPQVIHSPALGRPWNISVYRPDGYQTSGMRYPVLYFLPGHGQRRDEWFNSTVPELADAAIASGRTPCSSLARLV